MTYDAKKDLFANSNNSSPGRNLVLLAVGVVPDNYPKGFRVFSDSGCTVTVVPINAPADTDTETLSYPAGLYIEPAAIRQITAVTGGAVVHGYVG